MFSYKENSAEIWRQVFAKYDRKSIETDSDVSKSDMDCETDKEDTFSSIQPSWESQSSSGNSKQASPPITYSDHQRELTDEEIEKCYQAARELMQIRMGPFGKPKIAPVLALPQIEKKLTPEYIDKPEIEIAFKFQFLIITERLKVTITQVKNIASINNIDKASMYVEACLMPGKMLRKKTNVEMGGDSVPFNSVMFFGGFDLDGMHLMTLRLILYSRNAACDRGTRFTRLGDVNVSLEDIDITSENCFTEAINTRICSKREGRGSERIKMVA